MYKQKSKVEYCYKEESERGTVYSEINALITNVVVWSMCDHIQQRAGARLREFGVWG